jgi:urea transporter
VAMVTTVAVSRTDDYLATNTDANPLVALTEGFQSAFLAVAVLAGIGVALALLLLGRPRGVHQEQLDLEPSPVPAGDR